MRRYGSKVRTAKDKRAAALQLVVLSSRPDADKVRSLVASYGYSRPDAEALVAKHGGGA